MENLLIICIMIKQVKFQAVLEPNFQKSLNGQGEGIISWKGCTPKVKSMGLSLSHIMNVRMYTP